MILGVVLLRLSIRGELIDGSDAENLDNVTMGIAPKTPVPALGWLALSLRSVLLGVVGLGVRGSVWTDRRCRGGWEPFAVPSPAGRAGMVGDSERGCVARTHMIGPGSHDPEAG